jgi:ferrous iron transport protein A
MDDNCGLAGCGKGGADTCTLNKLGIGCQGSVVSVGGDVEIRRRLLEMGFCNGATVEVIRRAPLGDPTEFRLRGYHLSLREEQARHVKVETRS